MSQFFRKLLTLSALFALQVSPIQADQCCPTDECFDPCGGWSVGADFLFWNVCKDNPQYGVTIDTSVTNLTAAEPHYAPMGWEPGFRLYAGKENVYCGWDMCASYTYLWASGSDHVESGTNVALISSNGSDPNSTLGEIDARNTLTYQTFDVLLGYEFCFCKCQKIKPFFGIQGVKIRQGLVQRNQTVAIGNFTDLSWISDYKALGLELGALYNYDLECGLGLFTRAGVSFVAGCNDVEREESFFVSDTFIGAREYSDDKGLCTPGVHLQVGLSYDKCWCDRDFTFRIGYEFTDWWNVAQIRQYGIAGQQTTTSSTGGNLMMHGLFVGMGVGF